MMEQDEIKLYHIICDLSKICKNYFYERKYLPSDAWSIDGVVELINLNSKKLQQIYREIKKNNIKQN